MITAHQYLQGRVFAVTPDGFASALAVAEAHLDRDGRIDPEAVAARLGRKLDNTHNAILRPDGVAVIPVYGALGRHMTMMKAISGGSTIEGISNDFHVALENPNVRAIVFDHDSPGGEVNGTSELAGLIRAQRGVKPIVAYVSNMACSASYWLASACDEIVAAPTAALGSIGVLAVVPGKDPNAPKPLVFVSTLSPKKRSDPETDEGKAEIMEILDDSARVFINDVAANRGITPEAVEQNYGQGGYMLASRAVAAGLADRLGSLEALCAELAGNAEPIAKKPTPLRPAAAVDSAALLRSVKIPLNVALSAQQEQPPAGESRPTLYGWDLLPGTRAEAFVEGDAISFRTVASGDDPDAADDEEDDSAADPTSPPPTDPDEAEPVDAPTSEPEIAPADTTPPATEPDDDTEEDDDSSEDDDAEDSAAIEGVAMETLLSEQLKAAGADEKLIASALAMEATDKSRAAQAESLDGRLKAMERQSLVNTLKAEVLGHSNDGIVWLGAANENVETLLAMCDAFPGGLASEQVQKFIGQQRAIAVSIESVATMNEGTDFAPSGLQSVASDDEMPATAKFNALVVEYLEAHEDATQAGAFVAVQNRYPRVAGDMYLEQNAARGQETYGVREYTSKQKKGGR